MSFFTVTQSDDCIEFIKAFEHFTDRLINAYDRPELYIIRIDNWFDHKWLGFSGKTFDIYDINFPDITFAPAVWKWRKDITVPPFSPNRIIDQEQFIVHENRVERTDLMPEIHNLEKRPSELNLNNRILRFCDNGLFLWFSSKSATNGRASIILYHTFKDKAGGWYASFIKTGRWRVNQVKNIDREKIDNIFSSYYDPKSTKIDSSGY